MQGIKGEHFYLYYFENLYSCIKLKFPPLFRIFISLTFFLDYQKIQNNGGILYVITGLSNY